MVDSVLVNAIRERRWMDAIDLVQERPELVHSGLSTSWESFEQDNDIEDGVEDQSNAGVRMHRGALHELCRQCADISSESDSESIEEVSQELAKLSFNSEVYQLAHLMIKTSHTTPTANRRLWKHTNKSILELYEGDSTPLAVLCARSVDFGIIQIFCESLSSEASRKESSIELPQFLHLLTLPNSVGCTPFHYLADNHSCTFSTMKYIMEACERDINDSPSHIESAILTADDDNENPVHWACAAQISPEKLALFVSHGKKPLWCSNNYDEFPMDLFCRVYQEDISFCNNEDEITLLSMKTWGKLQGYLKIIEGLNTAIQFPVHAMAATEHFPCPCGLFDLGLAFDKEALQNYNYEGLLPLHLALARNLSFLPDTHAAKGKFCIKILEKSKAAVGTPTREGRFAIHIAVENAQPFFVVQRLAAEYPAALSLVDPKTRMWPFMLAAIENNSTLDIVYKLLRECPSLLQSATQ